LGEIITKESGVNKETEVKELVEDNDKTKASVRLVTNGDDLEKMWGF